MGFRRSKSGQNENLKSECRGGNTRFGTEALCHDPKLMSFCEFNSQVPFAGEYSEQLCFFQLEIQQQREMAENDRARRNMKEQTIQNEPPVP
jgi:hypothetical protein